MGSCNILLTCGITLCILIAVIEADDSCDSALPFTPNFDTDGFKCQVTWTDYNVILRSLLNDSANILSVVVSAKQNNQWVGMGFSEDGMMVGATAMVAWKSPTGGAPLVFEYHLEDASPEGVVKSNHTLHLLKNPMAALDGDGTLFMAFQADLSKSSAKSAYTLYAIGPYNDLPSADGVLEQHDATQSMPSSF
ncbi:hypothetical protein Mapa_011331 [Marchantia paleacea]|nr:hypothetical protein Mapa_011331 [Marchantia paleacea]